MRRAALTVALFISAATLAPGYAVAQYVELPPGTAAQRLSPELLERVRQDPSVLFGLGGWAARVELSVATGQAVEGDLPIVAVPALFSDSEDPFVSAAELRA
ncbi:MAG TPA: hypothetical protein VLC48_00650, partial [Gemmatimonadota bacterium]|nr:hypothetical protein [Gemmatimonadota bacterium]